MLYRIPDTQVCHAGSRGFESRPLRHMIQGQQRFRCEPFLFSAPVSCWCPKNQALAGCVNLTSGWC